jgi:ATP-dependent RNA helicase HrpB
LHFDPYKIDLPVRDIIGPVQEALKKENALIVSAPPGAGKSTLLPLTLLDEEWLAGKKILMLEPRRLAAKTIAARLAYFLGEKPGETIGYRIRFEHKIGKNTRIEVLTEGILTRMLQTDNSLEEVGLVIFDEFHERSIFADIALAMCYESQQVLRPDLRMMVMSATLEMQALSQMLKAPVIESLGKQYPVELIYTGLQDERMLPELMAQTILRAAQEKKGDILAFLPGEGEIKKCESLIKPKLKGFSIHPLYGMLPPNKQFAAIMPHKEGRRKVVLTTSIAETSLTIEGVGIVIDSGFGRVSKYDPKTGLSKLATIQISQDSATQRAGRAGRLSPGTCYRMWNPATQHKMLPHRKPEILETDLASLILDLAKWGSADPTKLNWLTPPPPGMVKEAQSNLHNLGALEKGEITAHGEKMHKLPCHPRIAHMLLKAQEDGKLELACDLAAILEERDPLDKEAGIDINLRIEALRRQRQQKHFSRKMAKIAKVAESYQTMLKIRPDNGFVNPYETGVLLVYAYPDRIALARPGNNAQFQLSNGSLAMTGHQDDLAYEPCLAIAHLDARQGMGRIFLASPLNPTDLSHLVLENEIVEWDSREGAISARKELRIGSIILQTKPLKEPDRKQILEAILGAIKSDGTALLDFNKEVSQLQNRVISLRKWRPDLDLPDFETKTLLATCDNWLSPYLANAKKSEDLRKLNLHDILQNSLNYEQQKSLKKLAPDHIKVPSGSSIKIEYQSSGEAPVLAVRLQEVFGLTDTPSVNNGLSPVLMHLLSPGFKPMQVTSDLKSFWNNTYFDIKKELKGRYPKHEWPDDPWNAAAIRGVKRKK